MKHINNYINEKLIINKNIKLDDKYHIETEDDLKVAIDQILTKLDDESFDKYVKKCKNVSCPYVMLMNSYDKLINALKNENNITQKYFATQDLITIIRMNDTSFELSDIYKKYRKNEKFQNDIVMYCIDAAKNINS